MSTSVISIVWFYSTSTDPEVIRTHTTTAERSRAGFDYQRQLFERANVGLTFLAVQPTAEYSTALGYDPGQSALRAHVSKLIKQRKGILHPHHDTITAVDTVYWLEDDPHPVDGAPTLFTSEQEVRNYGCVTLGLPVTQVEPRVRTRRVYTIN